MKRITFPTLALCVALTEFSSQAAVKYWDVNGATAGSGQGTANGVWNTSGSSWTTDSTGSSATTTFASGDIAVFSAGSDATSAFSNNVPSALTIGGMTNEEGSLKIGGAAVGLGTGVITIKNGAKLSIPNSANITGSAGSVIVLDGGTMENFTTGAAGSFVSASIGINVTANGGILSFPTANTLNIISAGTPGTIISGPGGITKVGGGVLAIATACTYQGPTIVNEGELRIRSTADRIPITTAVTVNSPGILNLNGVNQTIGSLSGNGSVGLANGILTVGDSTSTTFNGPIADTANAGASGSTATGGKVIKVGTGTLTFGGVNTFTGPFTNLAGTTTVNAGGSLCGSLSDVNVASGTINLNNAAQTIRNLTGSGTVNLGSGTVLTINPSSSSTFAGTLTGPGGITKVNSGFTVTLSGNNNYDGPTVVTAGRFSITSANGLGSTIGDTTIASGAELLFDGPTISLTINEPLKLAGLGAGDGGAITIQNSANVTIAGPVTLTSDVTNTVAGSATAVYSNPNSFTSLGNQSLTLQGGGGAGGGGTVLGVIALGSGGLTKQQSGRWTLSGANTYGGDTTILLGTLRLGADGVIPDGPGKGNVVMNSIANSAILDVNGKTETINGLSSGGTGANFIDNTAGNGSLTIGANDRSSTFNGVIKNTAGSLAITKTGAGTLTLGGANAYSGDTTIASGTIVLGSATAIPSGAGKGNLSVSGVLDLNGQTVAINGLSGSGLVRDGAAAPVTFTVGSNDASGLFSGTIVDGAGTLSLVKVGTNSLVLSGANTFSGSTTISNGTLIVSNAAIASTSVAVRAGAMLAGSGAIPSAIDLSGTISPGASPGTLGTGSENWNGGGRYLWQINNATNGPGADPGWDLLQINGGLNITAAATNKFIVDVASLATNVPGVIDGFDAAASNLWVIAQVTDAITNFDANAFHVVQTGFSNELGGQIFAVAVDNETNLVLALKTNSAPTLTVPVEQTIDELTTLTVTNSASDPDAGTTLTFSLVSPPSGMTIDPVTGVITWTPSEAQGPGVFTIAVVVSDDAQTPLSVTNTFSVTVNEVNSVPSLAGIGDQTINEMTTFNVTASATDSDLPVNALTYSLDTAPAGMTIDAGAGVISWSTTESDGPGVYTVKVVATDNGTPNLSATNSFSVTVNEVNSAPLLTVPANQTIDQQTTLNVSASASDSDIPANALTFSLPSAPATMTIDPNTGAISWTPTQSDAPGVYTVQVSVTDDGTPPLSVTNSFTVAITGGNNPPTVFVPADQTIDELTALNVSASATDPDSGNSLTFSLGAHPSGMTIVPGTGAISWTPTEAQGPNTNIVEVIVTDNGVPPLSATNAFTVVVREVNSAPALTVAADQTIDELATLTVTNTATDSDVPANTLTFSLGNHPTGMTVTPDTGIIAWTPTEAQGPSSNLVEVVVTDDGSPAVSTTNRFVVMVNEVNSAPSLTVPADQTINEQVALNVSASATDADEPANVLTFSLPSAPAGMTIDPNTGAIAWTPTEADGPAVYTVHVAVTDDGAPALSVTNSFTVTVNEVNTAPTLFVPADQTINESTALNVSASATDPDLPANTLNFSLGAHPSGMTIVPGTGAIAWTPSEAQGPATNVIEVIATDDGSPALSVTNTFTVTVNEVNVAPSLTVPADQTIDELTSLNVTNVATDPDLPANTLTFSLGNHPTGMTITPDTGIINWTPTEAQGPSSNLVEVVVTDDGSPALSTTNSFVVMVNDVNSAPSLTVPADQTLNELTVLNVSASATDSDIPANALTFSLPSAPAGMTIDPNTGAISWATTEGDGPGVYTIAVAVTDDGTPALSVTNTFTVTVNEVNSAPLLTVPADQTINELTTLNVSASATDSDLPANTLTFSLLAPPTGMTIVPGTGAISWTPTEAQGPTTNVITVVITDNGSPALSATNSFTVTVNEVNTAPSLPAISDRTAHAGQTVTFTNAATDSDLPANTLTYSLDPGAPAGASLGSTSGVFIWATTSLDANTTNAITVRVTDDGTPALDDAKSFTITVVSAPTANISVAGNVVTISWTAIAGQSYRVQYKNNLDDANWTDLAPDVTSSGSTASGTDTTILRRYYRIAVLP